MRVKITDKMQYKYLKRFMTYLRKNYPIKKKGANLDVQLIEESFIPFCYNGEHFNAEATFGARDNKATIKIAVGCYFKTPRAILVDGCHEYRHAIQYFDLNEDFTVAANSYYEDARELDAKEFSERVVSEYLIELGIEES